jgi:hypothetical protein
VSTTVNKPVHRRLEHVAAAHDLVLLMADVHVLLNQRELKRVLREVALLQPDLLHEALAECQVDRIIARVKAELDD